MKKKKIKQNTPWARISLSETLKAIGCVKLSYQSELSEIHTHIL